MKKTDLDVSRRSFVVAAPIVVATTPVAAQDWLKKGLEILEDLSRGQGGGSGSGLTTDEIVLGLREALRVGTSRTINRIGRPDGYFLDNLIHIPLPRSLQRVQNALKPLGLSRQLDDVEKRLNRAAEKGAPKAKALFFNAINQMTVVDAVDILRGPDNAATLYFQRTMTPPLKDTFRPVINRELENAGAFRSLENAVDQVSGFPIGGQVSNNARKDLADHGLEFALNGLFHYLGKEEAAIRNDPVKRTTEILKKVFA